jgi:hypothetical protein
VKRDYRIRRATIVRHWRDKRQATCGIYLGCISPVLLCPANLFSSGLKFGKVGCITLSHAQPDTARRWTSCAICQRSCAAIRYPGDHLWATRLTFGPLHRSHHAIGQSASATVRKSVEHSLSFYAYKYSLYGTF